ncbi:MAG TPA: hypothetical protein VN952_07345, partial [Chthoniobacterales bacterium]|nr:hypothetical protein [Chthoniobacterales bacterium]
HALQTIALKGRKVWRDLLPPMSFIKRNSVLLLGDPISGVKTPRSPIAVNITAAVAEVTISLHVL